MTKQFNTTKEELQKLGREFKFLAFPLIDDLFNLAFWLVIKKRYAKKVLRITYKKAIYYCDKTKADTDWQKWMHRIFFNRIFDHFDEHSGAEEFDFELIDNWKPVSNTEILIPEKIIEKKSAEVLKGIPNILLLPLVLKDIYNLPYYIIAEFVDVPDGVINTRIFRARKLFFIKMIERNLDNVKKQNQKSELIFELRKTAAFYDEELDTTDRNILMENMKTDHALNAEFEIQRKVKNLLKNSVIQKNAPNGLKRKIKKLAEKRFSIEI